VGTPVPTKRVPVRERLVGTFHWIDAPGINPPRPRMPTLLG